MILIEAQAAIDAAGTVATLRLSDKPFVTRPTDTPANVAFEPALKDPGKIGLSAYGDGRTSGGTRLETGEVVAINADGRFDRWLTASFDGRPVTIREGEPGGAYPADYPIVFNGTAETVQGDLKTLVIRLRDKQFMFDRPVNGSTYAGSNALPDGLEGTSNDLKGRRKPHAFGQVLNLTPDLVNSSKLTFQVNDGAVFDVPAVYDMGVALTKGADYATGTALNSAAGLAGGSYYTCKAEGYFRLGGSPAGLVTTDVTEGATAADRTIGQLLQRLALASGLSAGEVSAGDVAALDAAVPAVAGVFVEGETTYQAAMDQVAASGGVYYAFDAEGVLRLGRLEVPVGAPAVSLGRAQIRALARRQARDRGLPVWKVSVRYGRIWTVQDTDVAGVVTAARKALLAEEYRTAVAEDPSVKTQFLLAEEMVVETMLAAEADAVAEAARLLALYKERREIFEVTVATRILTRYALRFMSVVELKLPRFGLEAGKLFRVIGVRPELGRRRVVLTVWG